jgi:hypothetical protein
MNPNHDSHFSANPFFCQNGAIGQKDLQAKKMVGCQMATDNPSHNPSQNWRKTRKTLTRFVTGSKPRNQYPSNKTTFLPSNLSAMPSGEKHATDRHNPRTTTLCHYIPRRIAKSAKMPLFLGKNADIDPLSACDKRGTLRVSNFRA